ncbi:MAG: hypothetical protein K0S38_193 [Candidatus Paceibacter sp.]|jgi:hypothetical protein|nr:hypothetical protein [Candidatus Paceibacter sp.]
MSDSIQFNEGEVSGNDHLYIQRPASSESEPFSIINLLKNMRIAKTDVQAHYILIFLSVVFFAIALYIMGYWVFDIGRSDKTKYIISTKARNAFPAAAGQNSQ